LLKGDGIHDVASGQLNFNAIEERYQHCSAQTLTK